MTPITRIEQLINAIIENDATPPSAVTRIEQYLSDIYNNTVSTLTPVTRIEAYLAKISGADVPIPAPVTRLETYLAAIAGEDIDVPTPVTRIEYFLSEWVEKGVAVLRTLTGTAPLTLTNAVARAIHSLTQYGLCTQPAVSYLATVTQSGAVEQRNVPVGWTQVEYIRSTGTQYIDLGRKATNKTRIRIKFRYPAYSSVNYSGRVYGARYTTTNQRQAFVLGTSNGAVQAGDTAFAQFANDVSVPLGEYTINEWRIVDAYNGVVNINGTDYGTAYTGAAFETPYNVILFGFAQSSTTETTPSIGCGLDDIASFEWWEDGTKVLDLLPVYDGTEYAMYDRVSGTILHNAGTGDFTGGSAVSPSPDTPMDLICNNGVIKWDSVNQQITYVGTAQTITDADGNVATVQTLFAVGDYKDTQEIITGIKTGRIGMYVFNGTEGLAVSNSSEGVYLADILPENCLAGASCFCTRYAGITNYTSMADMPDNTIKCGSSNIKRRVYIRDNNVTSAAALNERHAEWYAEGKPAVLLWVAETATTGTVPGQVLATAPLTTQANVTMPALVTTSADVSTPDPYHRLPIWCNNGELAFGKPVTLNNTRYYAYLGQDLVHWAYSNDSYSIVIPVTVGNKYRIKADPTTPINGVQNVILRWAFVDSVPSEWTSDLTPSTMSVDAYNMVRSTPQDTQDIEVTATKPYMVLQMGASIFASNIANGRISVTEQKVYADGTPETLYITDGKNLFPPYAVADELYPVEFSTYTAVAASAKCANYTAEIRYYNSSKVMLDYYTLTDDLGNGRRGKSRFNMPPTTKYISISRKSTQHTAEVTDLQLEIGSECTAYVAPQTVTNIPNKLALGNYKDAYEFISGLMTHKVGVYVITGTESGWKKSFDYRFRLPGLPGSLKQDSQQALLCTHYRGVSVANVPSTPNAIGIYNGSESATLGTLGVNDERFKELADFLAYAVSEYAAGHPIMFLYRLATDTTETLPGHALHTTDGTNVVDVSANASPVELEVEYYAVSPRITQNGTELDISNVSTITSISQSGTTLTLS